MNLSYGRGFRTAEHGKNHKVVKSKLYRDVIARIHQTDRNMGCQANTVIAKKNLLKDKRYI